MLIEPSFTAVSLAIAEAKRTRSRADVVILGALMSAYLDQIIRPRVKPKPGRN